MLGLETVGIADYEAIQGGLAVEWVDMSAGKTDGYADDFRSVPSDRRGGLRIQRVVEPSDTSGYCDEGNSYHSNQQLLHVHDVLPALARSIARSIQESIEDKVVA